MDALLHSPQSLLEKVDSDTHFVTSLPPASLKSLAVATARASGTPAGGLLLCALATCAAARLGVQGPGALPPEEAKELCTLVLHRIASSSAAAARAVAGGGGGVEAACLLPLLALLRAVGGAPLLFRRAIPDAVVLGLFVLHRAPPHGALSCAAAQLVATAALWALRQGRDGGGSGGGGGGGGGVGGGAGTPALDATPLVHTLLGQLARHSGALARHAALAPVDAPADAEEAAAVLGCLPAAGFGNARASKELLEAVGGGGSAPAVGVAAAEEVCAGLCAAACGTAAVLTALLRRPLPLGSRHAPVLHAAAPPEGVALPLGALLGAAERLCDASAELEAGASAVQAAAAAAALRDGARRGALAGAAASMCGAGLRLLAAALGADGATVARRHRALLARALLRALRALRTPPAPGAGSGGATLRPPPQLATLRPPPQLARALLLLLVGVVDAWLRGPGMGLPTPDTCGEAVCLVNACADAAAAPLAAAAAAGTGAAPAGASDLPLPESLALAATLLQHAWAALFDAQRETLEQAALALATGAAAATAAPQLAAPGGKRPRAAEGGGGGEATPTVAPAAALVCAPIHAAALQLPRTGAQGAPPLLLLSAEARGALVALLAAALVSPWASGVQSPHAPRLHAALRAQAAGCTPAGARGGLAVGLLLGALAHRAVVAAVPVALPAAGAAAAHAPAGAAEEGEGGAPAGAAEEGEGGAPAGAAEEEEGGGEGMLKSQPASSRTLSAPVAVWASSRTLSAPAAGAAGGGSAVSLKVAGAPTQAAEGGAAGGWAPLAGPVPALASPVGALAPPQPQLQLQEPLLQELQLSRADAARLSGYADALQGFPSL